MARPRRSLTADVFGRPVRLLVAVAAMASASPVWARPPEGVDVPDVTVAEYPAGAENLLPNGDLEQPNEQGDGPAHWQRPDGLVWHWTTDPSDPDRGKVLRINTDVLQGQAYAWWVQRYIRGAALGDAPARTPPRDPGYNTIAGLDGGFYWSGYIPVKPGGAYRVYVDAKGPKAKVFIRGYEGTPELSFADEHPSVQEIFRKARGQPTHTDDGRPIKYRLRYRYTTWFAVGGSDQWRTCTHRKPRHPNSREITEDVRFIRIMIYPYWPRGTYWFDNIRVVEVEPDDEQARPEAEEADVEEGKVVR